ncbi:MAG: glycine cleavage system protein R [Pseudohongiellaceae bacterium]
MTTYLVLTAIGTDKPGLVESLSEVVAAHGGNWLESSMSQLAGKFAGILRVSVSDEQADELITALEQLSTHLRLVIERVAEDQVVAPPQTVVLSLVGNDRPGIVRDISHALTALAVNVEQLNSECEPAPMSGEILFKARATLRVPATVSLEELQSSLEKLADDLMVEVGEKKGTDSK